jgi:YHS domain-containing protein
MRMYRAFAVLAVTFAILWPAPAYSETFNDKFAKDCPNGSRIATLQQQLSDVKTKDAEARLDLTGELSQEYYFCSISVADPFVRDAAKYLTSSDLWLSARTNGDSLKNDPVIITAMNELAAVTKFSEIRLVALKLRADVSADFAKVNAAVYGAPEPAPKASNK